MSEEKNLSDDLNEMLGDAKEGAKKAADKAEEFAKEAKEKASEFAKEAKDSAKEFSEDAKVVFSDGKNVAIIAHFTLIGWIIALVMNSSNKTEFGSFYIRQMLGLMLLSLVSIIPVIGWVLWLVVFIAWIMSLVSALGGTMKPTFLFGKQFQEWFNSL
jgi:hypothetical protein